MTTLNTIIEEEKKLLRKRFTYERYPEGRRYLYDNEGQQSVDEVIMEDFLTSAMQRAYEAGKADWLRSEIEKLEGMKQTNVYHTLHCIKGLAENHEHCVRNLTGAESGRNAALTSIITRYKEELLELEKGV